MVSSASKRLCLLLGVTSVHSVLSFTREVPILQRSAQNTSQRRCLHARSLHHTNEEEVPKDRRRFLLSATWALLAPTVAQARGLVQFPVQQGKFLNNYHLMHAGTSLLEEEGIWSTNPLFLTNREDALSPAGQDEVMNACSVIEKMNMLPSIVKCSLAAACIDSCNLIARELKMGRDRLVPEFTFMDPRAIGQWDMLSKHDTEPAVWAMDVDEAGEMGLGGRPPPNEDGTPNETLSEQAVRLRQVLSILETQYSGDTILLIFPDGTSPALLSAMMAGIPYNRVHEIEFEAGEVRCDVTRENTLELWKSKQNGNSAYLETLERGRTNLATLREANEFVNMKDQKIEAERLEMEQQQVEKEQKRDTEETFNRKKRAERQLDVDRLSDPVSPVALGVAGLGAAASVVSLMPNDENMEVITLEEGDLSLRPPQSGNTNATLFDTPASKGPLSEAEVLEPALVNGGQETTATVPSSSTKPVINGDARRSIFDEGPSHPENPAKVADRQCRTIWTKMTEAMLGYRQCRKS